MGEVRAMKGECASTRVASLVLCTFTDPRENRYYYRKTSMPRMLVQFLQSSTMISTVGNNSRNNNNNGCPRDRRLAFVEVESVVVKPVPEFV